MPASSASRVWSRTASHLGGGAETVAVAKDGAVFLMDKFGAVWKASSNGQLSMDAEPVVRLGPGRPLGFHLDKDDNLIVCNAGTVCPTALCTWALSKLCDCYLQHDGRWETLLVCEQQDLQAG